MSTVDREIRSQVAQLQREHPELTALEAERVVLNANPSLYKRYVRDASTAPAQTAQAARLSEVTKRAEGLMAKAAGLSYAEAVSTTFRESPELYQQYVARYAKQDSTPAPTFADALFGAELEGVYPLVNALLSTLRGIAEASTGDKGAKIQAALSEFNGAVLRVAAQAGIPIPNEKRASDFIPADVQAEILKTAGHLCRGDYLTGMQYLKNTLQELRGAA